MENKKNRGTVVTAVILGLVSVSALAVSLYLYSGKTSGRTAYIYSGDRLVTEINLGSITERQVIRVESENGGYNIVEAEPGRICVSEASCPDKVCVHMGYISDGTFPVSCLPNRLIITVK